MATLKGLLRAAAVLAAMSAVCGGGQGRVSAESQTGDGEIRLIVRGDDIGSSQAANIGCIKSYREGIMRTVEVMVPCPWFEEAVKLLNENPGLDVGVHLTLTSEWENYKWRPMTCAPSLTDKDGYFYQMTREWDQWPPGTGFYDANPKLEEVEKECRAQIETALKRIKNVSHVSTHMGTAACREDLAAMVKRLAEEYDLAVDLRAHGAKGAGGMGDGKAAPESRGDALAATLEKLGPGLWTIVDHPGYDTPEMRAIGHKGYEHVASDRHGVTMAFTSEKVKEVIRRRNIKLMSYGDFRVKGKKAATEKPRRFFSEKSFWNQPLPDNPEIDPNSDHYISLLAKEPTGHRFVINLGGFTIPVYEVDEYTPKHEIKRRGLIIAERMNIPKDSPRYQRMARMGHGPGFGKDVPIPDYAKPDPNQDRHIAMVDWNRMTAWDMFSAEKLADGTWASLTGMVYPLDGDGVFNPKDFAIENGESIHFYGPGRAAGVPIIAGLITYEEAKVGEIPHKIAAATRFNAWRQFVFPATWTDGMLEGGIPEGAVIQLDPKLDLSKFNLLPGEKAVAKALQRYGMVIVDWSGGNVLYAEGLYAQEGKSWDGLLDKFGGIDSIPIENYRVLKLPEVVYKGDHDQPRTLEQVMSRM